MRPSGALPHTLPFSVTVTFLFCFLDRRTWGRMWISKIDKVKALSPGQNIPKVQSFGFTTIFYGYVVLCRPRKKEQFEEGCKGLGLQCTVHGWESCNAWAPSTNFSPCLASWSSGTPSPSSSTSSSAMTSSLSLWSPGTEKCQSSIPPDDPNICVYLGSFLMNNKLRINICGYLHSS